MLVPCTKIESLIVVKHNEIDIHSNVITDWIRDHTTKMKITWSKRHYAQAYHSVSVYFVFLLPFFSCVLGQKPISKRNEIKLLNRRYDSKINKLSEANKKRFVTFRYATCVTAATAIRFFPLLLLSFLVDMSTRHAAKSWHTLPADIRNDEWRMLNAFNTILLFLPCIYWMYRIYMSKHGRMPYCLKLRFSLTSHARSRVSFTFSYLRFGFYFNFA